MRLKYRAVAVVLALTAGAANATTYNYVGPDFDSTLAASGYSYDPALGNKITGSVTFNSDTSNFTGQIATTGSAVLSLELTSGSFSLSSTAFGSGSPLYGGFTFVNGQITAWSVCGRTSLGGCEGSNIGIAGNGLFLIQVDGSISQLADDTVQEVATTTIDGQTHALGARVNANCTSDEALAKTCIPDTALGAWTEVGANATPLPAALPLFASGLGALGLLGWRRKRKSNYRGKPLEASAVAA